MDRREYLILKFNQLDHSKFRSSFHLNTKMRDYVEAKGIDEITRQAYEIVSKRLAPAYIENDGKQTPMKNHPVFIAQHATGTCCRGCLEKWHKIKSGHQLSEEEINYVVLFIVEWIKKDIKKESHH